MSKYTMMAQEKYRVSDICILERRQSGGRKVLIKAYNYFFTCEILNRRRYLALMYGKLISRYTYRRKLGSVERGCVDRCLFHFSAAVVTSKDTSTEVVYGAYETRWRRRGPTERAIG